MLLTDRQNVILKNIVEIYIKTAEPVGSKMLLDCAKLKCSSATIRNEMAFLEKINFLEKTHTSSGRVPSEEGYRYYIENLIDTDEELNSKAEIDLEEIFSKKNQSTEEIIKETVDIISDLTNYTSIVLGSSSGLNKIKKIEGIKISNNEILMIIITDSGHVENKNIYFDDNTSMDKIIQVVDVLNKVLFNVELSKASSKLKNELNTNDLLNYLDFKEKLFDLFVKVFEAFSQDKYYVQGQYKLLEAPEFKNPENIKTIVKAVEGQRFLSLVSSHGDENRLTVTIGSENNIEFMENCTLITVPYYLKNGEVGKIAVVGPKRMNYKKVIPLLKFIADNINKL